MKIDFTCQMRSTQARHHSALFLEARIGLPATVTYIGWVWPEGMILSATHELRAICASKVIGRGVPSATSTVLATAMPLTTSSTGTSPLLAMRAQARFQP